MEVQYELIKYGIPLTALQVDVDGVCKGDYQKLWVEERKQIEKLMAQVSTAPVLMDPRTNPSLASAVAAAAAAVALAPPRMAEPPQRSPNEVPPPATPEVARSGPTPVVALSSTPPLPVIAEPNSRDVLLGRGKPIDRHAGNVKFRQILQQPANVKAYQHAPVELKREVATQM